jgi:uncharacterized protein
MVLDLRSLFVNDGEKLPLDCRFDLSNVEFYGERPLRSPVTVKGSAYSRAGIVTLSVICDCEYTAPCDRCGSDTVKHYNVPIERVLVSKLENGENDEIILLEDFKLDLKELVFTEVVCNLPSKHLCSEDCKGLCQQCGKNLNDGPCGCATKSVDPRLAALAQLLEN